MTQKPALLTTFGNTVEADLARISLEQAGIISFLESNHSDMALGHVGSALGGVQLYVLEADVDEARRVLSKQEEKVETASRWKCTRCREINEANFDICWSCNGEQSQLGEPYQDSAEEIANQEIDSQEHSSFDDLSNRAWKSAVIGLLFFPLSLYSLYLAITLMLDGGMRYLDIRRKVVCTLLIIAIEVIFLWAIFR